MSTAERGGDPAITLEASNLRKLYGNKAAVEDIIYADGRVYGTAGHVVDVSNPGAPEAAGQFAFSGELLRLQDQDMLLMLSPPDFGESGSTLLVIAIERLQRRLAQRNDPLAAPFAQHPEEPGAAIDPVEG